MSTLTHSTTCPTVGQVESLFHTFMSHHGHSRIEGHQISSPTPEVLFTTAGMHPLIAFLRGKTHPHGRQLSNTQRCLRTVDLDEVGDDTHLTVFEMLGSWSLGDYGKPEAIELSSTFLFDVANLDPQRIYVTVFGGDGNLPSDETSEQCWHDQLLRRGIDPDRHIQQRGTDSNWWSMGPTGPCGPDTEVFYYVGQDPDPTFDDTSEFVEVWNNVFMDFDRHTNGTLSELSQHNVDTGMGLERLAMVVGGHQSIWDTDELSTMIRAVINITGCDETDSRVIADHLRSSLLIISDGVVPSPGGRGYVLRRLLRRVIRKTGSNEIILRELCQIIVDVMGARWHELSDPTTTRRYVDVVIGETRKFVKLLERSSRLVSRLDFPVSGDDMFKMYDTHGIPPELVIEQVEESGGTCDPTWKVRYDELVQQHQLQRPKP